MHLILEPETGRVQSAGIYANPPADAVGVDALPEGNITDYRYADGEFIYDPELEDTPVMSDSERISALEAQLAAYEAAYTEGVQEA